MQEESLINIYTNLTNIKKSAIITSILGVEIMDMFVTKREVLLCIEEQINYLMTKKNSYDLDLYYHHNRSYDSASFVLLNGLLSKRKLYEVQGKVLDKETIERRSDPACANGVDYISLAKTDLKDLYRDEWEYDPRKPYRVDFLISDDVKTRRYTENYGNEFLASDIITNDYFRFLDIRILECINVLKSQKDPLYEKIVSMYNRISEIAKSIIDTKKDICLREASDEIYTLDLKKAAKLPTLQLKK